MAQMRQNDNSGNNAEEIRQKSEALRRDAREMGGMIRDTAAERAKEISDRSQETINRLRQEGEERYNELRRSGEEALVQVEEYVKEEPLKALAMAAGAGVLLGLFFSRK